MAGIGDGHFQAPIDVQNIAILNLPLGIDDINTFIYSSAKWSSCPTNSAHSAVLEFAQLLLPKVVQEIAGLQYNKSRAVVHNKQG
jgi:hypothetical protein